MTKVFPLRASEQERSQWQEAAMSSGLSFNAWARQRLNEAATLDLVERDELKRRREEREKMKARLGGDAA